MPEDDPKWRAIDELRGRVTHNEHRISALTYEQKLMREQYDRLYSEVKSNGVMLQAVHEDITTAKVSLALGRWLTSTSVRLLGVVAAIVAAAAAWIKFKG